MKKEERKKLNRKKTGLKWKSSSFSLVPPVLFFFKWHACVRTLNFLLFLFFFFFFFFSFFSFFFSSSFFFLCFYCFKSRGCSEPGTLVGLGACAGRRVDVGFAFGARQDGPACGALVRRGARAWRRRAHCACGLRLQHQPTCSKPCRLRRVTRARCIELQKKKEEEEEKEKKKPEQEKLINIQQRRRSVALSIFVVLVSDMIACHSAHCFSFLFFSFLFFSFPSFAALQTDAPRHVQLLSQAVQQMLLGEVFAGTALEFINADIQAAQPALNDCFTAIVNSTMLPAQVAQVVLNGMNE